LFQLITFVGINVIILLILSSGVEPKSPFNLNEAPSREATCFVARAGDNTKITFEICSQLCAITSNTSFLLSTYNFGYFSGGLQGYIIYA